MEKNSEKEITNCKTKMNSKSRIINGHKQLKNNSNKAIKPQKSLVSKIPKKEGKIKLLDINNKSLTDWNKKKIKKKLISNLPTASNLYLKKKVIKANNINCLLSLVKKKNLSCTQEGIDKYTKNVGCNSNNISNKKIISDDISKCADIEMEIDKVENDEEETLRVHIPHMTNKKKYNYFFELQKTEIKKKNENNKNSQYSIKLDDLIGKTKNRIILFPKEKKGIKRNKNENDYKIFNYKKNIRAKTEKKKDENKENNNLNHNHNYNCLLNKNKINILINKENSFLGKNIRQQKKNKNIISIKNDSELNQFNNLFNLIKRKENNNNKIINNNNHTNKKGKEEANSKTIEYNFNNSSSKEKKRQINKRIINISILDTNNMDLKAKNLNNNENVIKKEHIIRKGSNDSPENITDREEDKFSLPNHKINHFFIEERKRCIEKFERNSKKSHKESININKKNRNFCFLSPKQNINIDLESTDENCYLHHANISVNYTKSSNKDNISSYKKNMNRLKNLTSERKVPVSLFLSPSQKHNLFKEEKKIKIEIKKIIKISFNSLLKTNKIKKCIEKFLDIKSYLKLSSLNKMNYKIYRAKLYNHLFENSINQNIKEDEKNIFIMKIINSVFHYKSKIFKNIEQVNAIYKNYKVKSKYDKEILKDLTRTFPKDKSFSKDSQNYKKLYNILTCYSNYNRFIGYAQGLNFIGAISIYIFDNEEISFLFLDSLINRFELGNYFGIDNKNLINKLMIYSNVLNKYISDIISYLDKQQINHGFFSTAWILTLFSNSMKKENLIISWAFMIIFGWKFFYSFVIQILKFYKEEILNTNVNELCFKMKQILSEEKFILEYNNIIKKTFDFMRENIIL